MARFYGKIGFGEATDSSGSGVWVDVITEKPYRGDVTKNTRRLEGGDAVNDNIVVSNSISIVADTYAIEHFLDIKYVEWVGELWTVSSVEVRRPRLILTLGDVYNGPTP